jgi:hypothetical protein
MKRTTLSRTPVAGTTVGLLILCFCPACKQAASTDTATTQVTASSSVSAQASAAASSSPVPTAQTGSTCAGKYQGEYAVSHVKPALSRKQGAPEQWEKDDGTTLAGKGTLTLQVDSNNVVSGSAEGALGQQTLRGFCDETALRVQLDSAGDELGKIQNAYFVADMSGNQAAGTLAAATGDSLLRRAGPVTVRRVQ